MSDILTRRSFLKYGAAASLSVAGAASIAGCAPKSLGQTGGAAPLSADDVEWDGAFDVIVVGFGGAGAASAISAAEEDAHVLLVDKAPEGHEGGNTRYCAQLFVSIENVEDGLKHYQALRGNHDTPDDVLEAYVNGMCQIKDILESWGADREAMADFTDLGMANLTVEYPELEGASAVRTNLIDGVLMKSGMWRFLKKGVVARKDKIDCWYESPAKSLIQDKRTGTIVGVRIMRAGKLVNIAARNGVVLALGGFENNPSLRETYLGYPVMNPIGTLYNEGDGIAMTADVGAQMWHMNAWENLGCSLSQFSDRVRNVGQKLFWETGSFILVGGDARRYINESLEPRHGHLKVGGSWLMPTRPERNIFIFDQNQIDTVKHPYGNWSDDFSAEVENGKLVKADTITALAEALNLDAETLQHTVDLYNESALSGEPDAFGRSPENMVPLRAPYYAYEVQVSILNTQGGPKRSAAAEALNWADQPIGHLYTAGEFGGVTSNMYQGGGNIAECIVFGKIAGANAAAPKEDSLEMDDSALEFGPGSGDVSIYDTSFDEQLAEGETIGMVEGIGGPIVVKVRSNGSTIENVEVLHQCETEGVGDAKPDEVAQLVIADGTTENFSLKHMDVISGATTSCDGTITAINAALGNPEPIYTIAVTAKGIITPTGLKPLS